MRPSLGIDLGSSSCCAYAAHDGELTLIPSTTGAPSVPCWVAFTADRAIVGDPARRQAATNAENTVFGATRLLGRKFYSAETTWLKDTLPAELVPAPNGDAWYYTGGTTRSPQELISYLLEHVRLRAEKHLGCDVTRAVIAIPAFFDERQRRATLAAAKLAGLEVERLLHAPTAAAIAHAHRTSGTAGRWAMLDFGAGGLDVSMVQVAGNQFEVLSSVGDPLLGGDDFDRRLVEHLLDGFFDAHGVDISGDASALHRLFECARNAKHELSHVSQSSPISLPMIARKGDDVLGLEHPGIGRDVFTELIQEELERIAEPCALALDDLGFGTDDMDDILLFGGMALMPAVVETISYLYRKAPTVPADSAGLTAIGAALYAQSGGADILLDELTPHSVGIKIRNGRFSPVIHRRSIIPCREQKIFATTRKPRASVTFEVYQGESELVNENVYLGRFEAEHVSQGASAQIALAFGLDESGVLSVGVGDGRTERRMDLEASWGLSDAEINTLIRDRAARSRIEPQAEPDLAVPYHASFSEPPPSPEERSKSLRPGPRRSMPPTAGTAVVKPKPLRQHSVPPPSAVGPTQRGTGPKVAGEAGSAFPVEVADDSLVGTTVGGRYVIEDIIADGGMGRVYLARHDVLDKKFALKVLHAELAQNDELAARFVREAQAAARIDSPHVIDISDFGRLDDGTGYFVMEYLSGQTLNQLIYDRGALSAKLIVDVALQLTAGLAKAHEIGIVHRDLKPDNVTLIQRGGHPYFCKILDFGIAKAPTSDSNKHTTLAGTLLGTPHYMAPEQIDGGDMDGRCDIYSLGAVMYEMATGKPPFDAETLVGVLVAHKTEDPVPVRSHEVAAQCPIELQAIIHKCLAKSADDRFATADDLHAALKALAL